MAELGFLLVGAGRGGTSLLAGLLDAHPLLEVGFEAHAAVLGDQALEPGERAVRYRELCERSAAGSSALAWGNKVTTEQIHALDPADGATSLALFFDRFADVRTIFIVRDGRACVESKVRRAGLTYAEASRRWRFSVEAMRRLRARGALVVAFEQLLTDSRRTLARTCDLLDVPFSARMLKGTASPKLPPEYRRDAIDPGRAAAPVLPEEVLDSISAELRDCGYLEAG